MSLTNFLNAIASDPRALTRLKHDPDAVTAAFGLSKEHADIVTSNNISLLQQAVARELHDTEIDAAFILIGAI